MKQKLLDLAIVSNGIRPMTYGYHEKVARLSLVDHHDYIVIGRYRIDMADYARYKSAFDDWLADRGIK